MAILVEYNDAYSTCIETHSSLRIFSNNFSPNQITELLSLTPSKAFAKGEIFGTQKSRQRASTGWFLSTAGLVKSLDTRRHLDCLLDILDGKHEAIDAIIKADSKIDIVGFWVSIGQGGPIIECEQMRRLAALGIPVWWDVYFQEQPNAAGSEKFER